MHSPLITVIGSTARSILLPTNAILSDSTAKSGRCSFSVTERLVNPTARADADLLAGSIVSHVMLRAFGRRTCQYQLRPEGLMSHWHVSSSSSSSSSSPFFVFFFLSFFFFFFDWFFFSLLTASLFPRDPEPAGMVARHLLLTGMTSQISSGLPVPLEHIMILLSGFDTFRCLIPTNSAPTAFTASTRPAKMDLILLKIPGTACPRGMSVC